MENPMAAHVHYTEHQRQMAWVNNEDWKIERTTQQYRMRAAVAKALVGLATRIAPTMRVPNPRTPAPAQ